MVSRGSLLGVGGIFPYTVWGGFGSKICLPLPPTMPPSSDSYTVLNFRYTVRFAPGQPADNPRTFTGQFRGVFARFRSVSLRHLGQRELLPGG